MTSTTAVILDQLYNLGYDVDSLAYPVDANTVRILVNRDMEVSYCSDISYLADMDLYRVTVRRAGEAIRAWENVYAEDLGHYVDARSEQEVIARKFA